MSETRNSQSQGSANVSAEREDQQSLPIDLAQKSAPNMSGPVPPRLVGDPSKPIYLVKQTGSPGPTSGSSAPLPTNAPPASAAVIQQGPVSVAVTLPIAMARIQAAIKPGTTVTLAPRATTLVTASGTYTNLPGSHVPKGPAAVASIAIPRSAATAAVIRPAPSAVNTPQTTGTRNMLRPTPAVRPANVDGGGQLGGTWVSVNPSGAPATTGTGNTVAANPAVYKPAGNLQTGIKNTTNLILTSAGHKNPGISASGAAANVGQTKATMPNVSSGITLLSVRGSSSTNIRGPSAPTTTGRPENKGTLPAAHRTPSLTITSTSNPQGAEKQYVKSGSASARSVSAAPVHIAARTLTPAATSSVNAPANVTRIEVSAIATNAGSTPVVFAGGLKNVAPITTVTNVTKPGAQGIAVQFPQMSVTAVASKLAGGSHTPLAGARAVTHSGPSGTSVPVASGIGGRTYLVSTQAATSSSVIPVAKVVPQPSVTSAGVSIKAVDLSTTPAGELQAGLVSNNPTTSASVGIYAHASSRSTAGGDSGPQHLSSHPAVSQSTTPSKMGSSPRPSILRKRDHDGAPLKAQKNLSAMLALTSSSTVTSTSSQSVASAAISPPSPRRELVGLTPISGGPNGDSSRSSSGGSTTLSASSSPGIPADVDNESNPSINIATSSASALLGKALSNIQVKQESLESADTSGAVASLMRMGSSSNPTLSSAPVEMSPRKKPRKQQLLGQELQEVRSSDDELQPAQHVPVKEPKHEPPIKCEPKEVVTVLKRPRVSLMSSYRQTWKARHHHFIRYSDVKLKDERRPTVSDLANQKHVMQKVHGWKIYHLSAQIDEMVYSESQVHDRLSAILEAMEKIGGKAMDRDMSRVNELIKGNLQRSKVIHDGLLDSKTQVQKIFEHKPRAEEIIHRYMYKRLAKKREKS